MRCGRCVRTDEMWVMVVVRRRTKPRPRRSRAPSRQPGPTEAPRDRHAATRRAEKTISLRGPILVRWSPSACGLGVLAGWLHTFSYKMISARSTPDFAANSPNKNNSYLDPSPHIPKAETAKPNVMGLVLARNYFILFQSLPN